MTRVALTLFALCALAGLSLALSFAHLGNLGIAVALAIACAKAALVLTIFMELARARAASIAAFTAALLLFVSLVGLALAERETRRPPDMLAPDLLAPSPPSSS